MFVAGVIFWIVSAFGAGAATAGVAYERPGSPERSATAGWYNTEAFRREAAAAGLQTVDVNGDAFTEEVKADVIRRVRAEFGQIDLVIYSIAAPRRIDPQTGEIYSSVIKPIGRPFTAKSIDFRSGAITEATAEPATDEEIAHTVAFPEQIDDELRYLIRVLGK